MRPSRRALAIVAMTLVSCSTQVIPASTPTSNTTALHVYSTTATLPLLTDLTSQYIKTNATIAFETQTGNYESVLRSLIAGETPFFLSNHISSDSLWAAPLGQDGIAIIVHPANTFTGLTMEQLRRIYQGHIGNWSDLGGENLELVIISREDGSGTRAEFERLVMGERRTTQSAQIAPSSEAMVASVSRQPGSIGYVSLSYLNDSVRALSIDGVSPTLDHVYDNVYPLRSTLYVIGLAEPTNHYFNFIAWAQSPEGQEIVGRHYAPLLK